MIAVSFQELMHLEFSLKLKFKIRDFVIFALYSYCISFVPNYGNYDNYFFYNHPHCATLTSVSNLPYFA